MDINRMTETVQTAIMNAQSIAVREQQQEVDEAHLFLALLEDTGSLMNSIIEKTTISVSELNDELQQILAKKPRVSGSGVEQGKLYITNQLQRVLAEAEKSMKQFKDEYLSVEHILLATASLPSEIGKLLKAKGVNLQSLLKIIKEIRGNQRVTTQSPEGTYEVLKKYGRDLVEEVQAGKVDPVIGRDSEIRHVIRILSRKTKNNPVLIGEPGVGKTAIVEGLAWRIVRKDVPEGLKDKTIFLS